MQPALSHNPLFARLGRYTRFVMFSKWMLAVLAVVLMACLIALPLLSKDRSGIRLSFVDKGVGKGQPVASPVMQNPEYRGSDAKGQQYRVNGKRAIQMTSTLIMIEEVEAQLAGAGGSWRSLTAARADYHQDTRQLDLQGEVTLLDGQGYEFVTERATIDTQTMEVVGDRPISGVGALGNILASSFEIRDSGKHIVFRGGEKPVRLHMDRKKSQKKL